MIGGNYIVGADNNRQYHSIPLVRCCIITETPLQQGSIEARQVVYVCFLRDVFHIIWVTQIHYVGLLKQIAVSQSF